MLFKETYPSWFYSINQGATTMWERWNSYSHEHGFGDAGMNSFNHYAYGAVGEWMYERIAGLAPDPERPGFRNENWRPWTAPWGQDLLVPADFQTMQDSNGDTLIYPQGDRSVPPSGRMPAGGYFFDTIVRQPPIDEEKLNPEDNLEEFAVLDDAAIEWYRSEAERLRGSTRGVVAGMPGTAFGDIALVPAPFLKHPKGIRDIANIDDIACDIVDQSKVLQCDFTSSMKRATTGRLSPVNLSC